MGKSSSPPKSSEESAERQITRLLRDLVRYRRKKDLRPSEIARRMGISRQQVYGIETGRGGDPSARTLERYAKAIGVRIIVVDR